MLIFFFFIPDLGFLCPIPPPSPLPQTHKPDLGFQRRHLPPSSSFLRLHLCLSPRLLPFNRRSTSLLVALLTGSKEESKSSTGATIAVVSHHRRRRRGSLPPPSPFLAVTHHPRHRLLPDSIGKEKLYSEAVKSLEFDRQLGPYTLTEYGKWKQLTSYITKDVIERIEPIGGDITISCESRLVDTIPKTTTEKALAEQLKNSKFAKPFDKSERRGCYYTQIPRVIKQKGIGGEELTSLNMDKTHLLESILVKEYEGNENRLLGELQFAYVAFLMGQSLEAFLQWKSLVSLLFGCIEAPFHTRSQLFTKLIKVIYYQIQFGIQKDREKNRGNESVMLDDSWFSADSFLYHLCKDFFSLINDASVVDGDLITWTRKFKELLENTLGWVFNTNNGIDGLHFDADDEFAPVVEMIDEQGLGESSAT